MGRKGSLLVPFLRNALKFGKYGTVLVYHDESNDIFTLNLAKSNKLNTDSIKIITDWNQIKDRNLSSIKNYSVDKQRLLMALKRSVYLQSVPNNRKEIKYRFLSEEELKINEIKAKTKSKNKSSSCESENSSEEVTSSVPDISNNESECVNNSNTRVFPMQNVQNVSACEEMSRNVQSNIIEIDSLLNESHIKETATFVSENKWSEVESLIFESRNQELQLYRYLSESPNGDVIILCKTNKDENEILNLMNAVFLKGLPGIIANSDLLKKLLSCHVSYQKLGEDHLILFLTLNSETPIYHSCFISNKLIHWNSVLFITSNLSA